MERLKAERSLIFLLKYHVPSKTFVQNEINNELKEEFDWMAWREEQQRLNFPKV